MASGSAHISTRSRGEPGEGPLRTPADHVLDRTADIDQKDLGQKELGQKDLGPDKAPPLALGESQLGDIAEEAREDLPQRSAAGRALDWLRRAWQFFVSQSSSSLTQQGQIIAHAIADSATAETGSAVTIDPDKLQNLKPGESYGPSEDALYGLDFPIDPTRVAPVLRDLVAPTKTRARIYDRDGVLLVDSHSLFGRGDVLRSDLPSPGAQKPGLFDRAWIALRLWLNKGDLPLYSELGPDQGKGYPEVAQALDGHPSSKVRITERGDVIVSVAVPVQRFRAVRGALLLSTQGADIDNMVTAERLAILKVFLIAAAVMVVLSILLAGTIAEPVRRLADAAESVRRRIQS